MARRASVIAANCVSSGSEGIVIVSRRSKPIIAASTTSLTSMTISAGKAPRSLPALSQISVRVAPGKIAWTKTPLSLSWTASDWLRLRTKALVPLYTPSMISGTSAKTDAMLMIDPLPRLEKVLAATAASRIGATTLS